MKKIALLLLGISFCVVSYAKDSSCTDDGYLSFQDKKNQSVESLEKILKKDPNDLECAVGLVNMYLKKGDVSKGFKLLMKIYKKNPEFIKSKKISKIVHVAQYITELEKKAKEENKPKYWNMLGTNYYKMGVFKEAAECYKKSLKLDPTQIEPKLNLSICLSRTGQKYRALENLMEILKKDKDNFYANYYVGKILKYQIGDKQKAKTYLEKALKLCKQNKKNLEKELYDMYIKDLTNELRD